MKKTLLLLGLLMPTSVLLANVGTGNNNIVLDLNATDLQSHSGTYSFTDPKIGSGYGNFSATILFDAAKLVDRLKENSNSKVTLGFCNSGTTNKIGFGTNFVSGSNTAGFYGQWENGSINRQITGTPTNISTGLRALVNGSEDYANGSIAATATVSNEGLKLYLTFIDSNGGQKQLTGTDAGLKTQSFGTLSAINYDTDLIKRLIVDKTVLDQSAANARNLYIIPEPSMFGLLAGMGALALVSSRRRRK